MFKEPVFSTKAAFVMFAYLLAASKFALIIMSMETGSSFEGMGASREAAFTAIAEPAFFLAAGTAVMLSGSGGFEALSSFAAKGNARGWLMAWLCVGAFFIMLLTEGSRVPVDDPNTHLELTMIHEVMALDNSGPHLALLNYTAYLKMFLFASLIALCLIPPGMGAAAAAAFYALIIFVCAVITGFIESLMARLRMTHVPQFIFFAVSLSAMLLCAAFILSSWGAV
jgi:formate hydrogenlyase subunit 4